MRWTRKAKPIFPKGTSTNQWTRSGDPAVGRKAKGTSLSRLRRRRKGWWARPRAATPQKAKRPIAAILRYLTLLNDQVMAAFPAGAVPPVEEVTLRTSAELEPFLREPLSAGWKPVYALPRIGQGTEV